MEKSGLTAGAPVGDFFVCQILYRVLFFLVLKQIYVLVPGIYQVFHKCLLNG